MTNQIQDQNTINTLRTMVKTNDDLQKLRIQMGNRITRNFKQKLGITDSNAPEKTQGEDEFNILTRLKASYTRITDGVIIKGDEILGSTKLPSEKKFEGDDLITSYGELLLVNNYIQTLATEQRNSRDMVKILNHIPIYTEWLSKIVGCGSAVSAVIISEFDIHKAQYDTSMQKYAGIDCITVGTYKDHTGKTQYVSEDEIVAYTLEHGSSSPMVIQSSSGEQYVVDIHSEGRSRKSYALVNREYVDKEGIARTKKSITFNPFLKTKLLGVLGPSFLKLGGRVLVNGEKLGNEKRLSMAKTLGFDSKGMEPKSISQNVVSFLREKGYDVVVERSKYNQVYYDYRKRLDNNPRHDEKSALHKHNMANRFMIKIFIQDLYVQWRTLEGLTVVEPYEVRKLGLTHNYY